MLLRSPSLGALHSSRRTWLFTTHLGVALTSLAIVAASVVATGCETSRAEIGAANAPVEAPEARPGDCKVLQERLCALGTEESPVCGAGNAVIGLLSDRSCADNLANFADVQTKFTESRKPCEDLVSQACAKAGPESETCSSVRDQNVALMPERCQELLAGVDQVVAELKRQEIGRHPLDEKLQAQIANPTAPSFGPADAKVTVVVFSDFECPYCKQAAQVFEQLRKEYTKDVRFVFRHFPLPNHQNAQLAAQAADAAFKLGKFWEFHDLLFTDQQKLRADDLEAHAKAVGLDVARFKETMASEATQLRVASDQVLGVSVAVQATPTLFVNGKRVLDPTSVAMVKTEIDTALGGGS